MMNPFSKRSAGSATSSEDKLFLKAKLQFTALCTMFVLLLVVALSGLLYYELVLNITDSFGDQLSIGSPQEHALHETLERLQTSIIITDIVIILLVAGLSYFFSRLMLRPIKRSLEAQQRFTSDASHELRTPLTVMKAELEVAMRGHALTPKETESVFRSTLEEVEKMTILTEQLLFLSRISMHQGIAPTTINLSELTERIVKKMKHLADGKNLSLASSVTPNLHILGHSHDIERVLNNLIQNAITYTKKGEITVQLARTDSEVILTVEDTGIGISDEHVKHIFERFFKVDASRDAKKGGAGLGLAITREIVERHGGHIGVTSDFGKWTKFGVHFPRLSE